MTLLIGFGFWVDWLCEARQDLILINLGHVVSHSNFFFGFGSF